MHADDRRIDHLQCGVMSASQCIHDPAPDARSTPTNEAVVAGSVRTERIRQIAPRCPRSQDPEDATEDTTVIHPWHATRLVGQHRLDGSPLIIGEFVAHDSSPRFKGGLNHRLLATSTRLPLVALPAKVAFWGQADINRQTRPSVKSEKNDPKLTLPTA